MYYFNVCLFFVFLQWEKTLYIVLFTIPNLELTEWLRCVKFLIMTK